MISHVHDKNEWMFSYRYMNMGMKGMQTGTATVSHEKVFEKYVMSSDHMRMDMHMLMAMYGITPRLTVMAMAHFHTIAMKMIMLPGNNDTHLMNGVAMGNQEMDMTTKTSGFGDTKVQLLYNVLDAENHQLLVVAGVGIPTGNIQFKGGSMYPNQRLPYAMQLGSGTWDVLPAISYMYGSGTVAASTQVTSVIRTGYNAVGYSLGNEWTSNTWIAYRWYQSLSTSLRVEAKSLDYIHGKDPTLYAFNEPSARTYNYGGNWVSGYVGATYSFATGFLSNHKLALEYGLPMYQYVNGTQMPIRFVLNASWTYLL